MWDCLPSFFFHFSSAYMFKWMDENVLSFFLNAAGWSE